MNSVAATPEIIGRECEHAQNAADPVIGKTVAEERAVPTIVLDHEQSHQKARRRHCQQ